MTINTKVSGTVLTISPEGRLDSTTSDEFLAFTREHFTTEYDVLAVDCAAVDYISSKGLRVLLTIFKGLGERKMMIINANECVREVLNTTGFAGAFDMR